MDILHTPITGRFVSNRFLFHLCKGFSFYKWFKLRIMYNINKYKSLIIWIKYEKLKTKLLHLSINYYLSAWTFGTSQTFPFPLQVCAFIFLFKRQAKKIFFNLLYKWNDHRLGSVCIWRCPNNINNIKYGLQFNLSSFIKKKAVTKYIHHMQHGPWLKTHQTFFLYLSGRWFDLKSDPAQNWGWDCFEQLLSAGIWPCNLPVQLHDRNQVSTSCH